VYLEIAYYLWPIKTIKINKMKKITEYEICHINNGRKSLMGQKVRSINGMCKLLKVGECVTASWNEIDPKKPKSSMFYNWRLGYREFTADNKGISYNRFPLQEY
jgi:hypothetical protein